MTTNKKILAAVLIVIGMPVMVIVLTISRYLVFPNTRTYQAESVQFVGTLYLVKNVSYVYMEVGVQDNLYSGSPPIFIKDADGQVVKLHDFDFDSFQARLDVKEGRINESEWPDGTKVYYTMESAFYIHERKVISFSYLYHEGGRLAFSRNGEDWYDMPMGQEAVYKLIGNQGEMWDEIRL